MVCRRAAMGSVRCMRAWGQEAYATKVGTKNEHVNWKFRNSPYSAISYPFYMLVFPRGSSQHIDSPSALRSEALIPESAADSRRLARSGCVAVSRDPPPASGAIAG